jgi:hypothetical protein
MDARTNIDGSESQTPSNSTPSMLQHALDLKAQQRRYLISLPIEEKLVIMEQLRDRAILLREARKRLASNSKKFTNASLMAEEVKLTPIDPEIGELMTVEEFIDGVACNGITPDDGIGYWATASQESMNPCWEPRPQWATHVMWYNK